MNKPTTDYPPREKASDYNIGVTDGRIQMDRYYKPRLAEALDLLRAWVNHEEKSHGGIEIGEYNSYYDALEQAKSIFAKPERTEPGPGAAGVFARD